jgi:hypothetical protein
MDEGLNGQTSGSEEAFEALLRYMRDSRGFDFTGYKRTSLMRRVRHRMDTAGYDTFEEYLDVLQASSDEFASLFNTILINVTAFFRDPPAWDYIRDEVIPSILAERGPNDPIRVWSAGCASGQEAVLDGTPPGAEIASSRPSPRTFSDGMPVRRTSATRRSPPGSARGRAPSLRCR